MLNGVDLVLPARTVAHVGGVNGAGKTTFLRLLAGLLVPDAGSIAAAGVDAGRRRAYQRLTAYASAGGSGLYARLTVRQHLHLWARMAFVPRSERERRVAGALDAFALADVAGRRADRLSTGQRQRLRLALAFLPAAPLALLDEPAASLDDEGRRQLAAAVEATVDRGGAVIWCSPAWDGGDLLEPDLLLEVRDGRLERRERAA